MTAPVRTERKTLIPEAYDLSDLLPCSSHILSHFAIPARAKPDLSIMKGTEISFFFLCVIDALCATRNTTPS